MFPQSEFKASHKMQRYKDTAAPENSLTPFWSKEPTFESA